MDLIEIATSTIRGQVRYQENYTAECAPTMHKWNNEDQLMRAAIAFADKKEKEGEPLPNGSKILFAMHRTDSHVMYLYGEMKDRYLYKHNYQSLWEHFEYSSFITILLYNPSPDMKYT